MIVRVLARPDVDASFQARAVAASATTSDEGPEGVGVRLVVAGSRGLRLQLDVRPSDLDDDAQRAQLVRLAERIQLMATAADNRRAEGRVARQPCPAYWRAGILSPPGAPADGAECTLERGHAGDHEFESER